MTSVIITEKKDKFEGLTLFFKILLVGNAILWFYFIIQYRYPEANFLRVNIFFDWTDRYMDFYNNLSFSVRNDPYSNLWGNGLPFYYLICQGIAKYMLKISGISDFSEIRFSTQGVLIYILLIAFSLIYFYIVLRFLLSSIGRKDKTCTYFFLIIFSYPFIFAIDRGNSVLQAAVLIGLFVMLYQNKNYNAAAVILGLAAALKFYPALFGLIFLANRKWKPAAMCVLTGIITTAVPLALFEGGFSRNLQLLLGKMGSYATMGNETTLQNLSYNNSFYMIIDYPYIWAKYLFFISPAELADFNRPVKYMLYAVLVFIVILCFMLRRNHDRLLVISCMVVLYPFCSNDYNLVLLFMPIIYWLINEPQQSKTVSIASAVLLICKSYISIFDYMYHFSITYQTLINPLLIVFLIGYIVKIRLCEICEAAKQIVNRLKTQI